MPLYSSPARNGNGVAKKQSTRVSIIRRLALHCCHVEQGEILRNSKNVDSSCNTISSLSVELELTFALLSC